MTEKVLKYIEHDPELCTPYEAEVLTILAEECAEVIKCVTKILRFGKKDHYPNRPSPNNTVSLGREIGDVQFMINKCIDAGLAEQLDITVGYGHKETQLEKYFRNKK
jgi:hypothetical protein